MKNTPIDYKIVNKEISKMQLSLHQAKIRDIEKLIRTIENLTDEEYIRMEMGIPGLPTPQAGIDAEIKALQLGVCSKYANMEGIPKLKTELSRFVKLFLNIDIPAKNCIPTVGAMQASYALFSVVGRTKANGKTLFIDPGFPVQKLQHSVIGIDYDRFDVYNYRGEKLEEKLESFLKTGSITSILYSNPNNPSWICFTEAELKIIGKLADKYDIIVIEDLAYFGMDFRNDYSTPDQPPYQPTVAHYTDNYAIILSGSKAFSYAGQRIGAIILPESMYNKSYPGIKKYFTSDVFGYAIVYGALYSLTAGVAHTVQHGFAAMLKAANDGTYNFVEPLTEYGKRAKAVKKLFTQNGFYIVYDTDIDKPVGDGFYFTVAYPGFNGPELLEELIYYGISAITLQSAGSDKIEGLRACVSQIGFEKLPILEERLKSFNKNHKTN